MWENIHVQFSYLYFTTGSRERYEIRMKNTTSLSSWLCAHVVALCRATLIGVLPEVSSVASLQIITVPHGVTVYIIIAGVFSSACIVVWSIASSTQFGSCKIQQVLSRWLRACRWRPGGVFRGLAAGHYRFSRSCYLHFSRSLYSCHSYIVGEVNCFVDY